MNKLAELHQSIAPLRFLIGTWEGWGSGRYPTIDAFKYTETLRVWHVGRPFLCFEQSTWETAGNPLHIETGYYRYGPENLVELTVAHPSGLAEVSEGELLTSEDGSHQLKLASQSIASTSTAKEVTAIQRSVEVSGSVLTYRLSMAAVGIPVAEHLEAQLRRL